MSNVNFNPWVGEDYSTGGIFSKKILVLGESHYCPKELNANGRCADGCSRKNMLEVCFNQTIDNVDTAVNYYEGCPYQQTFLCFERAVMGRVLSDKERKEFWNSVMFYNYIQFALPAARTTPSSEQLHASEEAFREILETYQPDRIIVWGARLYKSLPNWDGYEEKLTIDNGDYTPVWHYSINGKDIPAMLVYHPSAPLGKSWEYWHQFHVKFIGQ